MSPQTGLSVVLRDALALLVQHAQAVHGVCVAGRGSGSLVFDSKVMRNRKLNVPKTDIHAVAEMYAQRLTRRSKLKTHEINEGDEIKDNLLVYAERMFSESK